jgi:hypothetical protein
LLYDKSVCSYSLLPYTVAFIGRLGYSTSSQNPQKRGRRFFGEHWEGQIAMEQTHLRNCISALSDQAAVLATCVSVQVRGELGVGANGRLDGDNNIAGEVGNSSH